jgi:hypothetical protein
MAGGVLHLSEVFKGDQHPPIWCAAGLWIYEVDDEQGLLGRFALPSNLAELFALHPVAPAPGVLGLDPILVPYSDVSFQVGDRPGAGLPPAPEGFYDLFFLPDGGATLVLGRDLLDLGRWVRGIDPSVGASMLEATVVKTLHFDLCSTLWGFDEDARFITVEGDFY